MTDLLTRLLALAELAVDEALEFEYGDPEERHIWRELQELKPLVAAYLAKPEPEGPTDEELLAIQDQAVASFPPIHPDAEALSAVEYARELEIRKARAVLARWGRPAIKPVPVSERLPGSEDCDGCGNCWWFRQATRDDFPFWWFGRGDNTSTHWLPHHALPAPTS